MKKKMSREKNKETRGKKCKERIGQRRQSEYSSKKIHKELQVEFASLSVDDTGCTRKP